MEALVITGYALYAVAVGLTGSMYMVSITALSACGVWCRPLTAWHPLHISGSGVGTDLGSGDIISGSGVGTDLGSGPISNVSKHMRMYYHEVFGLLAEGRGMGWKPLLVPYWVVVGSWVLGSWWWSWGGALLEMRSIFLWVQACAICLGVSLSSGVWGLLLGFVPSRGASRGPLPCPFLPPGAWPGRPLSLGVRGGVPGRPLARYPIGLRPKHTGA